MNNMTVADLFCGAGGFSEGFKQAGFNIVYSIDIDKYCCWSFEHNHKNTKVDCADIKLKSDFPKVDVVIGSPPCKQFSRGNINRTLDLSLVKEFMRVINIIKPKYWVMENTQDVDIMCHDMFVGLPLPDDFHFQILEATDFGVSSKRKRFFGGVYPFVKSPLKRIPVNKTINTEYPGFRAYETLVHKEFRTRIIDIFGFAPCITANRKHIERYILPNGRQLEVGEMAKLMGFPDNYLFIGSRSKAIQEIGNAVCPPVAKVIA